MSKKVASKEVKKVEEKPKLNYEDLILRNLSNARLTLDKQGYQFVNLNLAEKSLDSLNIVFQNYKALQNIDLHGNNLSDISVLSSLPNLIRLNVSQNNIKDMKALQNEEGFRNLKYLNLQKNRINELLTPKCPNLMHLNLNENNIDKMETFEGLEPLKILELRSNRISSIQQLINMPKLQELYLAQNKIKQIVGIDSLVSLQRLHLRQNNIEVFEETFPNLENLQYLNLRENKVEKIEEINKLVTLPNLKVLIHSFNPIINKNANYLFETINSLLKLERINKLQITKNIKLNAFAYAEDKYNKDQQERKRIEEEELLKQQQEENKEEN
ncbi:leucine rich repeat protein [Ichthyophthirius multifiliis]|uniref:Leucine rich repeat protein n=1 Tax=Ichthyophthirius multifiliis TaxID=5932 RepID=G0QMT1_ICHMU|nr:leucine rich repeat protein [Ichthyophthirius multifiliis]EGR33484.1 leucine rich repeat protein [Ichthyophthirius multifiliis]|eukprot:XP_004037470.1 leucine rich repeat protein [Ichthyophthirius multifiliis]